MTEQQALEILKRDDDEMRKGYFCINDFLALEVAKTALEKQIAKKPTNKHKLLDVIGFCPNCRQRIYYSNEFFYCPNCGQKLDWEVTNEQIR